MTTGDRRRFDPSDEDHTDREFAQIIAGWDLSADPDMSDAPLPDDPEPGSVEASIGTERFEPPPVDLPGGEDWQFWAIVVGMTGGPMLLIVLYLADHTFGSWWVRGALLMTIASFALLVWRQPARRSDDDPDDGARL